MALKAFKSLKSYAAKARRPGNLAEQGKVIRKLAINAMETNRPQEARALLTEVRADAASGLARIEAVRSNETARKQVFGLMVSIEHLERGVAEFAVAKTENDLSDRKLGPPRSARSRSTPSTARCCGPPATRWKGSVIRWTRHPNIA